jgi:hypothetical protein
MMIPEIDSDQTTMSLPLVTSTVPFTAKSSGKTWAFRRNIRDVSTTPLGKKCEWYVHTTDIYTYMYVYIYIVDKRGNKLLVSEVLHKHRAY